MTTRKSWIRLAAVILLFFVGCNGIAGMDYFCSECAVDQNEIQFCLPGNRTVVTAYIWRKPTAFTALVRAADPEPCRHRWIFAAGKGGLFIQPVGADARRVTLRAMEKLALVTRASQVDPSGSVDLIRWALRTDIPEPVFRERCIGPDGRPVDFGSMSSFRAWFEAFRRKTGSE